MSTNFTNTRDKYINDNSTQQIPQGLPLLTLI